MSPDSLMERLGAADPAMSASPDHDTAEAVLRQVFSAGVSSASAGDELAARVTSGSRPLSGRPFGLGLRSTGPPRRHLKRWTMVGAAAAVAAAAVSLLVVGSTGGGPCSAFAGWTPDPTHPAAGQLQAGESVCASNPSLARLTPTLADARGPFSAFLYAQASTATICVVGPGLTAAHAEEGPIIVKGGAPSTASIAPGTISTRGPLITLSAPTVEFGIMAGQVGRGVTAVRLTLDDGSNVKATIEHGWFAAWWPSPQGVKSADLTTTGSTTQPLNLPKPGHCMQRRYLSRCKVG